MAKIMVEIKIEGSGKVCNNCKRQIVQYGHDGKRDIWRCDIFDRELKLKYFNLARCPECIAAEVNNAKANPAQAN